MCRGTKTCILLGTDKSKWSKLCPLPLPKFFENALEAFSQSVAALASGDKATCLIALGKSNSDDVREFFIEHGQQSSYFRVLNRVEIDKANILAKVLNTSPRLVASLQNEVFKRDSFRCRYCEMRIISKEVFTEFSRIVGAEVFSVERENSKRNGLTLGLRGVADHVEPYASGGKTDIDNLVTSCYSCNFGKAGYTLEQLGIDDPRLRPPVKDDWQGLTEYLSTLRKIEWVAD